MRRIGLSIRKGIMNGREESEAERKQGDRKEVDNGE